MVQDLTSCHDSATELPTSFTDENSMPYWLYSVLLGVEFTSANCAALVFYIFCLTNLFFDTPNCCD